MPRVRDLIRKAPRRSQPKQRPYAIRKPGDVTFEKPGDVIQIDATASNAADFLDKVTAEMPWPIKAIQACPWA